MGYLREFMLKKGTQMATLSHKSSRIITVYSNNSANFAVRASPRKWVARRRAYITVRSFMPQRYEYASEKSSLLELFATSMSIFMVYHKDTKKRARNMKFTSIFFTASENIYEVYLKDTNKRANKKDYEKKSSLLFLAVLFLFSASESIFMTKP